VLAAFRLTAADVTLVRHDIDRTGNHHLRYTQTFNGLDVVGGDLLVQIFFAKNRRVHSASHGTILPGTLLRSGGQAPVTDIDVNAVYDATGAFYEAYQKFWNRDSYDDAGAALVSSVHYLVNYCNLFWNGTQMVYGDGLPSAGCLPLARAVDLTAHELTHAVTERESALIYSGESGGLNESISDAFGAFVEAWVDGGKTGTLAVSADTWKMGEDVLPPAAFYLMSQGGTHPRGKSTVHVTGIGMDKAIRVLYTAAPCSGPVSRRADRPHCQLIRRAPARRSL
jgi:vibriolysin